MQHILTPLCVPLAKQRTSEKPAIGTHLDDVEVAILGRLVDPLSKHLEANHPRGFQSKNPIGHASSAGGPVRRGAHSTPR